MPKKIVDQSKICADIKPRVEKSRKVGKRTGILNKPIDEAVGTYERANVENIMTGDNNNFVILGRDRPSNPSSGFGGKGGTQAGRIDLIVGMASSFRHKDGSFGPPCSNTIVNPNFAMDASRIYISQKAEIDKYMGIAPTEHVGETVESSAIGLKSDAIRIHARRDIKIVTGRARVENVGKQGERLSGGGQNEVPGSISFIAGNYTEDESVSMVDMLSLGLSKPTVKKLQPLVKGGNLEDCLRDIFGLIKSLAKIAEDKGWKINSINTGVSTSVRTLPTPVPIPIPPSPTFAPVGAVIASQGIAQVPIEQGFMKRVENMENNYLGKKDDKTTGGSVSTSPLHILSKYVYTT
jgi:hypothetical protein